MLPRELSHAHHEQVSHAHHAVLTKLSHCSPCCPTACSTRCLSACCQTWHAAQLREAQGESEAHEGALSQELTRGPCHAAVPGADASRDGTAACGLPDRSRAVASTGGRPGSCLAALWPCMRHRDRPPSWPVARGLWRRGPLAPSWPLARHSGIRRGRADQGGRVEHVLGVEAIVPQVVDEQLVRGEVDHPAKSHHRMSCLQLQS